VATARQLLGSFGEQRVVQECQCPRCKRNRSLVRLPNNFRCADIICDFCGYLAQVKCARVRTIDFVPNEILGAAWGPQQERMKSGIYFPLFVVLTNMARSQYAIFYLSADLQEPSMFRPRSPLSAKARRAGWQGFIYDLRPVSGRFVRLR
jgi:hypothetical protein